MASHSPHVVERGLLWVLRWIRPHDMLLSQGALDLVMWEGA